VYTSDATECARERYVAAAATATAAAGLRRSARVGPCGGDSRTHVLVELTGRRRRRSRALRPPPEPRSRDKNGATAATRPSAASCDDRVMYIHTIYAT